MKEHAVVTQSHLQTTVLAILLTAGALATGIILWLLWQVTDCLCSLNRL